MRTIIATVLSVSLAIAVTSVTAGCGDNGDDEAESYPTYQECFDDHTTVEMLTVEQAIVVCCLDHPIAGVHPVCGDTTAACEGYLGTNLATASATSTQVTSACATYISEKNL